MVPELYPSSKGGVFWQSEHLQDQEGLQRKASIKTRDCWPAREIYTYHFKALSYKLHVIISLTEVTIRRAIGIPSWLSHSGGCEHGV